MRISVEEVKPGLHRWVARLHHRNGEVVAFEFSNDSADAAEDGLLDSIMDAQANLVNALHSLEACYAHAEEMTCDIEKTDDTSEFPYLVRAKQVIEDLKKTIKIDLDLIH